MTGLNPLDWHGGAFLALYVALFGVAFLAGFAISARLRPDGSTQAVRDDNELAVLARKGDRLAETAVARLLARAALTIDASGNIHRGNGAEYHGDLDREILAQSMPLQWTRVRRVAERFRKSIEENLVRRGLMMPRGEARMLALWSVTPLIALIAFGYIKVQIGMARDRPVGFLVMLLCLTALVGIFRWSTADPRTRAGIEAWRRARTDANRLKLAPTGMETGRAVALFGTAVLATSPLGEFHKLRAQTGGDGGTSGGDSGCGSSGCGGGGCGGCGS